MADGAPNGYSIMTFDGKNYQLDFKAAGRSSDYQMRITLPDEISSGKLAETDVYVNIFNGSEKSKVTLRIDNSDKWMPMIHSRELDPAFVKMHQENRAAKEKKNPNLTGPKTCPHLWKVKLPESLSIGTHLVTIKEVDMNGKVHTGQKVFRVVK